MNPILEKFSVLHPGRGEVALCRLGQHSFLLKLGETLIAVDPYLSNDPNRLLPPLISPEELCGVNLVIATHDHGDHIDRPSWPAIAAASPEALFVVPEAVRGSIGEVPAARLRGLNDGERAVYGDIELFGIAAAHEFLDRTEAGLYPYLGYVIKANGVTLYHSGDCCVYEGLLGRIERHRPEVMLLPINGRDAWRYTHDCIGNMTWQEAADLAGWAGAEIAVPAHYDMFSGNTADPLPFLQYVAAKYPKTTPRIMNPGEIAILKVTR